MEVTIIVSLATAFLIELIVILFKIKLVDPHMKKKEEQANLDVVALKEQFRMLDDARKRKLEEAKSIENIINKISAVSNYMPINEFKAVRESLEEHKEKHYSIIKKCEEYDVLIKDLAEEINKIRKERKLKYL